MNDRTQENKDNILVVRLLEKDLFPPDPARFEREIFTLLKIADGRLVLNLADLDSLDSNLLRVLMTALKESLKFPEGDIKLVGINESFLRALRLYHLDCLFCCYGCEDDAIAAFNPPAAAILN